ncbi:UDP-4-amino-4,6-dideoxy-N-acetyl-beta-L-altrosamine transaminase [Alteromonas mediterranea]|uniref:UDP-4-amino-4, 6-dideoxy-N-acetyl-beta-L-altrosamine transaminase n=1 Tax=Alteromonas mediterranea TaxID=314275 RepID=UPI00113015FA|nr:UDP-4-amino-4,6-dideoxy-N-acetyl-beta-L-altrosamine transaminase [Alteromonas mediterranea]QDG37685.1 UDP-4-amino-4,6-dideoxy-N-acetyl-beta-L-altrosamine transaminase [Alteromonas mediterranea]
MIPYGRHKIFPEDINAVTAVLKDSLLTQGEQVPQFEQAVCAYTGAGYGVACNSGTSGLHLACLVLGVKEGDIVWTVPNSFAASANCARYCGAVIDFVDIDPQTRNLCLNHLSQKLNEAAENNTLPKALVVVHFAGHICDMASIAALTKPFGIALIEDAAHALGGKDARGNAVGRCTYSLMTVLSFHPVKSITSAEGGMVLTNDASLATLLRRYATHGITRDESLFEAENRDQPWFYTQLELGYNYRLSDLHAALGRSQMMRLDTFVSARLALAKQYDDLLAELPIKRPLLDENSAWHLYTIELVCHEREAVFNALRARGIGVNVHYIPIHFHPYYKALGFTKGMFPNAETYYKNVITLPLFPTMTDEEQREVVTQLTEVLKSEVLE